METTFRSKMADTTKSLLEKEANRIFEEARKLKAIPTICKSVLPERELLEFQKKRQEIKYLKPCIEKTIQQLK